MIILVFNTRKYESQLPKAKLASVNCNLSMNCISRKEKAANPQIREAETITIEILFKLHVY